ncbi:hypothetical protein [Alicyclobacillus sp.]|uniref:hypothetical protein n=1 Tax=Alicyclobacillus sp. TaxID=61169 RepID=UPI0025B88B75|nr:hypothetical protein [Alicyclobacillus sp.]MCL6515751.1 hypothetical protein [Alicyclobacillus sp.]
MAWVYYLRLFDSRFQADCLRARLEAAEGWAFHREPRYIGIFQTLRGRYGIKVLW